MNTIKVKSICQLLVVVSIGLVLLSSCTNTGEGVNPGLVDIPLVYAKRTIPLDDDGFPLEQFDLREPFSFSSGGDLYIRTASSSSSAERNITRSVTLGLGDVKDTSPSYDGKKVLFSLRLFDEDPNDDIVPQWNIYEYDYEEDVLRRVIALDDVADDGNDLAPCYLPDGRIVFSSDRQKEARGVLSDESAIGISKPQFSGVAEDRRVKALVLHVMDANGENIHQISFNLSHDLDPVVMPNGRILFSRWEGAGSNNSVNLYTINPDGSDLQIHYGDHASSHLDANDDVIHFTKPRVMKDGRIMVLARPFTNTFSGGDILVIDGENYIDITQPTFANQNTLTGPAQVKASVANVSLQPFSLAGRYASAFPLLDGSNRIIVSKGLCQLTIDDLTIPDIIVQALPCVEPFLSDPLAVELSPAYGLWLYDMSNNTERPLIAAEAGFILTDAVVLRRYDVFPAIIPDAVYSGSDADLVTEHVGILNIRSVYDMGDGAFTCALFSSIACTQTSLAALSALTLSADQRPARFIRLIKPVSLPDRDDTELVNPPDLSNNAFGPNRSLGMREIIGYAMVEPDGSVKVKVPANVAFGIEILDKSGRRIGPRHDDWLQVKAGETLNCDGCHQVPETGLPLPHGRRDAVAATINDGMPTDSYLIPGSQIPGTALPYLGDYRDTMAEVRTRTFPAALNPGVDIIFTDNWVNPALDAAFSYNYSGIGGLTTPYPIAPASVCHSTWAYNCRAVINYKEHIQPLWEVNRGANTCTTCHNAKDAGNADQVPAGQLELTNADSMDEPEHIVSYRELLFADTTQELNAMNMLVDKQITVFVDVNGVPTAQIITDPDAIDAESPSMTSGGARSSYFMEKLTNTELNAGRVLSGATNHTGFLTDAELRLIAEWLDLGGQYFNNPFDTAAPQN